MDSFSNYVGGAVASDILQDSNSNVSHPPEDFPPPSLALVSSSPSALALSASSTVPPSLKGALTHPVSSPPSRGGGSGPLEQFRANINQLQELRGRMQFLMREIVHLIK